MTEPHHHASLFHFPPTNYPLPQLCVAAYLAFGLDEPVYGAVLLGLILPQVRGGGEGGGWGKEGKGGEG